MVLLAREPTDEYGGPRPPAPASECGSPEDAELRRALRDGEIAGDRFEEDLTRCARARGAIDVATSVPRA